MIKCIIMWQESACLCCLMEMPAHLRLYGPVSNFALHMTVLYGSCVRPHLKYKLPVLQVHLQHQWLPVSFFAERVTGLQNNL